MKDKLKSEILKKIKKNDVKVRPKLYFQVLRALFYITLTALIFLAVFVFNLVFYLPKRNLVFFSWTNIADSFPWTLLIVGSLLIGILVYLYRHYAEGYKKQIGISILVISILVLASGFLMARSNINEKLERGPRFRRFYDWNQENFGPRRPMRGPRFHQPEQRIPFNERFRPVN